MERLYLVTFRNEELAKEKLAIRFAESVLVKGCDLSCCEKFGGFAYVDPISDKASEHLQEDTIVCE